MKVREYGILGVKLFERLVQAKILKSESRDYFRSIGDYFKALIYKKDQPKIEKLFSLLPKTKTIIAYLKVSVKIPLKVRLLLGIGYVEVHFAYEIRTDRKQRELREEP